MLLVATGLLSPVEGNLLGVKRDVTMLNAGHIIPGCMWGSSIRSFTIAMLELSGCLTSSWCSMMGLVGVGQMGTLASIVVLFVGPVLGDKNFVLVDFIPHLYGILQL